MKEMRAKTFVVILCAVSFASFAALLCANAVAELRLDGEDKKEGVFSFDDAQAFYENKLFYIAKNRAKYDAFILGGSKAGALHTEKLNEKSGLCFYNLWSSISCFEDYEKTLDFLLSKNKFAVKEIVLHLSCHTAERKNSIYSDVYRKAHFHNFYGFIERPRERLKRLSDINRFFELLKPQYIDWLSNQDGSRRFIAAKQALAENPGLYLDEHVYNLWGNYDESLENLFTTDSAENIIACDFNIEALKRIKRKCVKNGITLVVVVGPTFIAELYKYASPKFIQYMKDFVEICPVWNFSGINGVNLNPFNFADGAHYFDFIGDKMIDVVFAENEPNVDDTDAFGIFLTPKNIERYIESQKQKWLSLKSEWERTGTIDLAPNERAHASASTFRAKKRRE